MSPPHHMSIECQIISEYVGEVEIRTCTIQEIKDGFTLRQRQRSQIRKTVLQCDQAFVMSGDQKAVMVQHQQG